MLRVTATTLIDAPQDMVSGLCADYRNWPNVFPTVRGTRLLRRDGSKLVIEVDHIEGKVQRAGRTFAGRDRLVEDKRRYHARFRNRFEAVPGGTRFSVSGDIYLKGFARLLQPFLRGYIRRQMERFQLQPVKAAAEARAHRADEPFRTPGTSRD